jgi:hypothetical protein
MNKIWLFGDSHTAGHGCTDEFEYCKNYKKDSDMIWGDLLSQWTGLECINKGKNGCSNDMIFDELLRCYNDINESDIVIVGNTYYARFDVPIKDKTKKDDDWRLQSVFNQFENYWGEDTIACYTQDEMQTIINFMYYFGQNEVWKKRQVHRFEFIKKRLEERGVRVYYWDVLDIAEGKGFETIQLATNGLIKDSHLSFYGHKQLGKVLVKRIFGLNVNIGRSTLIKNII